MAEHDTDLADVLQQFTNLIMNERVRAHNEGLDAERERCAKIADDFAAYEQTVVDRAHADEALSDSGRKSIVSSAGSRQVAAEQIAHDIRTGDAVGNSLTSPSGKP